MKFVCLGYFDEQQFASLPAEQQNNLMEECFSYDDDLRWGGHFLQGEALGSADQAVTIRARNGSVDVTDGPFSETKELLGGILLLEARDLNHAIALISKHPGIQCGPFEVRAADEEMNQRITRRDALFRSKSSSSSNSTAPLEIHINRIVEAPIDDVFDACTNSEHLAQWWGPRSGNIDWTTPLVEIDPQAGGAFRTTIQSPEGDQYTANGTFQEVIPSQKIVCTHGWEDDHGHVGERRTMTLTFAPSGENTRLRVQIENYSNPEILDSEIEGWHECFDRLVQRYRATTPISN